MSTVPAERPTVCGAAVSLDGTTIGYRTYGCGPGLVVLHGAMQSGLSQLQLAQLLATETTVHLVDRRGRGLSGPYAQASSMAGEVEDLAAVVEATGARTVMGVSSGALIALQAALTVPAIDQLVLFEPPLLLTPADPTLLRRYAEERAAGDLPAAMVTAMLIGEMGPGLMRALPRRLLVRLTRSMLVKDDRKAASPTEGEAQRPSLRLLAELLAHDLALVEEQTGSLDQLAAVEARALLLNGTKTRPYLKAAVASLATVLPNAQRRELAGLDHGATQDASEWGKPDKVAPAVLEFLRT